MNPKPPTANASSLSHAAAAGENVAVPSHAPRERKKAQVMLHQLWHPNPNPEEGSADRSNAPARPGRRARPKPASANLTTTDALLERCKGALQFESDYRLAKALGISKTSITHWRNGRTRPDDLMVIRMAEFMRVDPAPIVAELHAERAKEPECRALWLQIAEQLRANAAGELTKTT